MATKRLTDDSAARPKVGRPPRIDQAMIVDAVTEIGLQDVTMKAVAERLGMSVTGLYHHVGGREELVRMAAERSASSIKLPVDVGQHWTAWLLEWATYSYDAFVAEPALLGQFVTGSLGVERMLTHMDAVLAVLTAQGFEPQEAMNAFRLVTSCALGAAIDRLRDVATTRAGHPRSAEYHRLLAQLPDDELPHLRRLVEGGPNADDDLVEQVSTVLMGIAVRRGEPWEPIAGLATER